MLTVAPRIGRRIFVLDQSSTALFSRRRVVPELSAHFSGESGRAACEFAACNRA